ncbi:pectinacetylesterase family protein [Pendulispora rubella]|uniref:Pectinacetylesterase family protein n=1 Tax=Pendulispora rubella TaxID=2741070 RepID=A0ABZ2LFM6_9BACT
MRSHPLFSAAMFVPCLALASLITSGASCGGDDSTNIPGPADSGKDSSGGNVLGDSGGGRGDSGNGGNDSGTVDGGDSGLTCAPFDVGEPAPESPANEWKWVPVAGAKCRNGSDTGFAIRRKPDSKKLMIYLQGGGACFNAATCTANPQSFDFGSWNGTQSNRGILSNTNAGNPVKDWNAVFFPYCSGDIFGGSVESGDVPGVVGKQRFTGVANVLAYLKTIVPTFPNVDQVLLTGSSAGGFGASISYERVAKAFCPRPVTMIDDAGPVMSDTYLAPCLQKRFREVWNLNAGLPADCTACNLGDGGNSGGLVNAIPFVIDKYPQGRFGLLSALQDSTIRTFMSFGENNCQNLDGVPVSSYPGDKYAQGLGDLRDNYLKATGRTSTYYVSGERHTFLYGDEFYSTKVGNVALTDWVAGILNGAEPTHVAP